MSTSAIAVKKYRTPITSIKAFEIAQSVAGVLTVLKTIDNVVNVFESLTFHSSSHRFKKSPFLLLLTENDAFSKASIFESLRSHRRCSVMIAG